MGLFGCCRSTFKTLSRAAAKSAAAKMRTVGVKRVSVDWAQRAAICEACPMRVIRRGVSYCGKPLLEQVDRTATEGCGCPTRKKVQDPAEHCPLTVSLAAADPAICDCKWCATA